MKKRTYMTIGLGSLATTNLNRAVDRYNELERDTGDPELSREEFVEKLLSGILIGGVRLK